MNRLLLVLLLCVVFLGAADTSSHAQSQTPTITTGRWNQSAKLQAGVLTYHWITPKPDQRLMAQSLAGYDQHTASITLTPQSQIWVRTWEQQYRVFSLPAHYPKLNKAKAYGYGSAFTSLVSVQDRGKSITSRWNQEQSAARADAAVKAFLIWAEQTTGGKSGL